MGNQALTQAVVIDREIDLSILRQGRVEIGAVAARIENPRVVGSIPTWGTKERRRHVRRRSLRLGAACCDRCADRPTAVQS